MISSWRLPETGSDSGNLIWAEDQRSRYKLRRESRIILARHDSPTVWCTDMTSGSTSPLRPLVSLGGALYSKFRNQTFVVGLSARPLPRQIVIAAQDLAMIQSMGVKIVLVHGGPKSTNSSRKRPCRTLLPRHAHH